MQDLGNRWQRAIADFQHSDFAESMRRGMDTLVNNLGPRLVEVALQIKEGYEWLMPPNWRPLDAEDMMRVGRLMQTEGLGLAWAPSAPVLQRLVAAPNLEARKALLMEAEGQVLADLDRALAGVERESLRGVLDAAKEATEAHRSGYFQASQALSGAGLSTAINEHFGRKFWEARRDFRFDDPEEEEITRWRISTVLGAISTVLETYNTAKGDPVPPHFNRHASAHKVGRPQYTAENSLCGVMLLASTVIEVDWISSTIERDEPDDSD